MSRFTHFLWTFLAVWFAAQVVASEAVEQQALGESDRFAAVGKVIDDYIEKGRIAGAVTMVGEKGKLTYTHTAGKTGIGEDAPMAEDALFRIYSMSKPIAAVALMQLYEQGEFELDDPISEFIPEFENLTVHNPEGEPTPVKNPPNFAHVLTHTAGFGYVFDRSHAVEQQYREAAVMQATDLDDFATRLKGIPLRTEPGTEWHYSVASDIAGLLVERISGVSFDAFLEQNVFRPLGMVDTFFSVPEEKWDRFLPNHSWDGQANVLRQHPARASEAYRNVTFFSGGGGLVGTAADYMRFAQALAAGGELQGVRILKSETVDLMRKDHLASTLHASGSGEAPGQQGRGDGRFRFGLGFGVFENGVYWWGGAAGTIFWIDPNNESVVVCMIQVMGFPFPLRRDIGVAVAEAFDAS